MQTVLMYKLVKKRSADLLPNTLNAASNYNLRNSLNLEIPFARLCSHECSVFLFFFVDFKTLE